MKLECSKEINCKEISSKQTKITQKLESKLETDKFFSNPQNIQKRQAQKLETYPKYLKAQNCRELYQKFEPNIKFLKSQNYQKKFNSFQLTKHFQKLETDEKML